MEDYTKIVEIILDGIDVKLRVDYLAAKSAYDSMAKKIVYT